MVQEIAHKKRFTEEERPMNMIILLQNIYSSRRADEALKGVTLVTAYHPILPEVVFIYIIY
jgi:hypothetical protein